MERSSTQRSDVGRAVFFERLLKAWEKRGDLSWGEFLVGIMGLPALERLERLDLLARLARMSDTEFAEAAERFALLGDGPLPPPTTERPTG